MSFQAKKHKLCHLAYDHVLKPATADADFCVSADISDLSISAAALALSMQKPMRKKNAASILPTGVGSPRGDWWEKQKLPHVPIAAQVTYRPMSSKRQMKLSGNPGAQPPSHTALLVCIFFAGLGVNQCFISSQFPKSRSGPWSRALAHWLPTNKQCLLTTKAWDREGEKSKETFSPYNLFIAHV